MSHVDSPLERKAAAERAAMGQRNAKGVNSMANRANDRDNFAVERVVDKDGDGKISNLERFDKDGDGKISMEEYAKVTDSVSGTAGGVVLGYAADSVGASAEEREQWGQLRAPKAAGQFVPNVKQRVQQEQARFDPVKGGWVKAAPTWNGPGDWQSNRNVRSPDKSSSNPFESRLFSGSHYAVADKSDETYAYSGARGIFKNTGAGHYVPEHYKRALAYQAAASAGAKVEKTLAPGTDVVLKGGWPIEPTAHLHGLSALPEDGRYGFSIENGTRATSPRRNKVGPMQ